MLVQGYASTPDMDLGYDVVVHGAFDKSLADRGITGPRGVKLLHGHDAMRVLGHVKVLQPRNAGLYIEAHIDERISYGKDVALAVENQGGLSFSIGYRIKDMDAIYNMQGEFMHWELRELDLTEVSVVSNPMNEAAQMQAQSKNVPTLASLQHSITRFVAATKGNT